MLDRGSDPTLLQLGVQAWSQIDGEDKLVPTRDVLANPGLFVVKGNDQQIARLGLRVAATSIERSYRVIVQEVPQQTQASGLVTLLKISVPIFVPPDKSVVALDWGLRLSKDGAEILVHDGGNVHVQITHLRVTGTGESVRADVPLNFYVLPGAARVIPIKLKAPIAAGTALKLHVESDQGAFSADVRAGAAVDAPGHG